MDSIILMADCNDRVRLGREYSDAIVAASVATGALSRVAGTAPLSHYKVRLRDQERTEKNASAAQSLETRRVSLAGITRHPTEEWMAQMGRNAIDETSGYLRQQRYVLHDRDTKFCKEFRETLAAGGVKCLRLPARSPNLNAFAERWVRSVKEECLSKLILFGEGSLKRALNQFQEHYLFERNHQGKGNILLLRKADQLPTSYGPSIEFQQRLGGLLKYYYRRAA
jgi:hypothetical protein